MKKKELDQGLDQLTKETFCIAGRNMQISFKYLNHQSRLTFFLMNVNLINLPDCIWVIVSGRALSCAVCVCVGGGRQMCVGEFSPLWLECGLITSTE